MKTNKIVRREFIKEVGVGASALGLSGAGSLGASEKTASTDHSNKQPKRKPNVVIVFSDQFRSFALGCQGNKFVHTPNIDRLAREGFRFELGITNSPVCVPARSNLMSGEYARSCVGSRINEIQGELGRDDRAKFPDATIAQEFKKIGYKTAIIGKWHIDAKPSHLGFDESVVVTDIFSKAGFIKNEKDKYKVPIFSADHEITKVKEFFKDNKSEPFLLYYNITSPHMPLLDIPYKYSRMYEPAKVPLRENVWKNGKLPADERWFQIYMWQTFPNKKYQPVTAKATPEFTVKDLTALYYGSVSWTDALVGEMMEGLRENGLEDETIVVFAADHGDMLGSHHCWNKNRPFEEAIRVPMIYRWPNEIKKGVNESQVTSLIDVMPTLLDLCGMKIPGSVQGQSVAELMKGTTTKTTLEENCAYLETPFAELAIRTPTHMYAVIMDEQGEKISNDKYLFFDMRTDPYQQKNLLETGEQSEIAQELREKLYRWNENTRRLTKSVKYQPWAGGYNNYVGRLGF